MHANNPMCHVSMYNQILSSAAGPCGKLAKLALMRSLNNSNKDALSGNAGHGDADGITQPNKDARCTGTEDFFQSSSNFKSADAATLTEARALTALRAAREENKTKTSRRQSVSTACIFHESRLNNRGHPLHLPIAPPIDRSFDRSLIHSSSASRPVDRARRAGRASVDGRRCTHKNTPRLLARASRPSHHRARDERVFIPRVAPIAYLRRVSLPRPASVGRASVECPPSSPRVDRRRPTDSERTNAIVIASSVHAPRGASAERVAVGARANPCEVRAIAIVAHVELCGWVEVERSSRSR